jgi:hypothetical protein
LKEVGVKGLKMLLTALVMSVWVSAAAAASLGRASDAPVTVVYDDVATEIATARVDGAELWVTMADLKRATRFELKPQGVCRDELCFPLPKERRGEFVRDNGGALWFHLTEFARLVRQPFAYDAGEGTTENSRSLAALGMTNEKARTNATAVWYFGLRADQREGLTSLKAPNFTLPDMAGEMHSLADFRGKKVLLVTWASW